MLIGGFYSVDGGLLCAEPTGEDFDLRLASEGGYDLKVYTNNGRTASVYAMKHCADRMRHKKVLLPDYLCLSVISAVEWAGIDYDFYRVQADLTVDLADLSAKLADDVGMIYLIHYFSVPQPLEVVQAVKEMAATRDILVMEDITQALFSKDGERMGFGDYIVASTRKWFPMTDGGLLAIKDGTCGKLQSLEPAYDESVYQELLISVVRMQYEMNPQMDKAPYLRFEKAANASRYQDLTPRRMTAASRTILFNTDSDVLMKKRIENYRYLYEQLTGLEEIEILSRPLDSGGDYVPFGLTLLAEDRDGLYRHLVERNVIPEIQWLLPVEYYEPGEDAVYLSAHNLMLQCDQRYDLPQMKYVAEVIREYYG